MFQRPSSRRTRFKLGSVRLSRLLPGALGERTQAKQSGHFLRTQHRFRAEPWIILDYESVQIKARPGEQVEMNAVDLDSSLQCHANRRRDPHLELGRAWPVRNSASSTPRRDDDIATFGWQGH